MLVSVPFWLPSAHEMQTPASQAPLAQSLAVRHVSRSGQRSHAGSLPPQSIPDSSPPDRPSLHVPSVHSPAAQIRLAQSVSTEQGEPDGQPGHSPPPQSMLVSLPFSIPSWHEALVQRPVEDAQNRPPSQSASRAHAAPAPHGVGQAPPQSRSDSS
jgi:hypothetical protein